MHTEGMHPPIPPEEEQRLAALRRYRILDTEPEPAFDRLTRLGARVFQAPIVLVSLVDDNRQWFKSCYGLNVSQTARDISFCGHAILSDQPMMVSDTLSDPRFQNSPLVTRELGARFYAGAPLMAPDGMRLGTFCIIDTKPRPPLDDDQLQTLKDFAALTVEELELRRTAQELRENQTALEISEARFHAFMDESPVVAFIKNEEGRLLYINRTTEEYFQLNAEDCLGKLDAEIWPADVAAMLRERDLATLTAGTTTSATDRIRVRDSIRHFLTLRFPFVDSDGRRLVGGKAFDITEQKRLEEQLRKLNRELESQTARAEESSRLKSEFLANMSHELRTPLNGIIGFSELLADGKAGPLTDRQQRFMNNILLSSRHLLHLINDLLDLARIEAGRLDLHFQSGSAKLLIGEVIDSVEALAALKHIDVSVAIDEDADAIYVDPARFKQVVYNYVSNAIKFTPENGRIAILVTREPDGSARLDVQDTGIGIESQDIPRLFHKFQQLETGPSKRFAGTGLGLALVKNLVERHGGRVEVQSKVGAGSTFSALFPLAQSATGL